MADASSKQLAIDGDFRDNIGDEIPFKYLGTNFRKDADVADFLGDNGNVNPGSRGKVYGDFILITSMLILLIVWRIWERG